MTPLLLLTSQIYIEVDGCLNPRLLGPTFLTSELNSGFLTTMDKMQNILRFVVEHHPPIFKISYVALILPIFILSSMFTFRLLSVLSRVYYVVLTCLASHSHPSSISDLPPTT